MKLEGKVAVITGAGSGIGRATARLFAVEGAKLILAEVHEGRGPAIAQELAEQGHAVRFLRTDTSKEGDVKSAIEAAQEAFGRLDILVNNAGVGGPRYGWEQVIGVNLAGVYYGCRHALPVMQGQGGGVIVNVASMAGLVGARVPGMPGGFGHAYTASKHGVIGLTRQFALDGAPTVRVNCICPGWVEAPLTRPALEDEEMARWITANTPLGRYARPEEIARGILFLASDDSSFMTGAALVMDGGWTAQ